MIREEIPKIDSWTQTTEDMIFTSTKNAIVLPVAKVLRAGENNEEMESRDARARKRKQA